MRDRLIKRHQQLPRRLLHVLAKKFAKPFLELPTVGVMAAHASGKIWELIFSVPKGMEPRILFDPKVGSAPRGMVKPDGRVEMFEPANYNTRSQDLEEAYQDAGQFYWGSAAAYMSEKIFFSPDSMAYVLPRHLVQDIDTPEDWKRAELMYTALKASGDLA